MTNTCWLAIYIFIGLHSVNFQVIWSQMHDLAFETHTQLKCLVKLLELPDQLDLISAAITLFQTKGLRLGLCGMQSCVYNNNIRAWDVIQFSSLESCWASPMSVKTLLQGSLHNILEICVYLIAKVQAFFLCVIHRNTPFMHYQIISIIVVKMKREGARTDTSAQRIFSSIMPNCSKCVMRNICEVLGMIYLLKGWFFCCIKNVK